MNKTEFAVIQRAAAILDKEEKSTRHDRIKYSKPVHRAYRNEIAIADEALTFLVHTMEENVDLISPFWNSELEQHVNKGEYPMRIIYDYYIGPEQGGSHYELNIFDPSVDPEGSPVYEGYDFKKQIEEDLLTMQSMGYQFAKPVKFLP